MIRACVTGWPIEHSRSPLIHGYWLKEHEINGSYGKLAVTPDDAAAFFRGLPQSPYAGCNVTVPLKEIAHASADVCDASAKAVSAANTLWVEDGKVYAANTDTFGFMSHLTDTAPDWQAIEGPIFILGSGGAARAIVHGFITAGCDRILICNRTTARAKAVSDQFGGMVEVASWEDRSRIANASAVIVNTTSLGMSGKGRIDVAWQPSGVFRVVCDIVYVPLETEFLTSARRAGHRIVDGLGMLLHQAVPGFERWFGVRPKVTSGLREHVLASLGRASGSK